MSITLKKTKPIIKTIITKYHTFDNIAYILLLGKQKEKHSMRYNFYNYLPVKYYAPKINHRFTCCQT